MNAALAKHWISSALFLERLLGDRGCGLVALEAYFTEKPEVTADYVAHRLGGLVSEDTARRRLNDMVNQGSATFRREGRTIYFKLDDAVARAAIAFMKGDPIELPPQIAVNSR